MLPTTQRPLQSCHGLGVRLRRATRKRSRVVRRRDPRGKRKLTVKASDGFVATRRAFEAFRRFRDFVRSKQRPYTLEDLESYRENALQIRSELRRIITDWYGEDGSNSHWFFLHVAPELLGIFDGLCGHAEKLLRDHRNGQEITNIEYHRVWEECLGSKLRSGMEIITTVKTLWISTAVNITVLWVLNVMGIDLWHRFDQPIQGWTWHWLLWTGPYFLGMYCAWHTGAMTQSSAFRGFKLSTRYRSFSRDAVKDPRGYSNCGLMMRSLHFSFFSTMYQGLALSLLDTLYPTFCCGADVYSIGFASQSMPAALWLPVELIFTGAMWGSIAILSDWSLLCPAEDVMNGSCPYVNDDPRIAAEDVESFHLLDNDQITRNRSSLTFFYCFLAVCYLTAEAIDVHSFWAPVTTLAIGQFVGYKGMQRDAA